MESLDQSVIILDLKHPATPITILREDECSIPATYFTTVYSEALTLIRLKEFLNHQISTYPNFISNGLPNYKFTLLGNLDTLTLEYIIPHIFASEVAVVLSNLSLFQLEKLSDLLNRFHHKNKAFYFASQVVYMYYCTESISHGVIPTFPHPSTNLIFSPEFSFFTAGDIDLKSKTEVDFLESLAANMLHRVENYTLTKEFYDLKYNLQNNRKLKDLVPLVLTKEPLLFFAGLGHQTLKEIASFCIARFNSNEAFKSATNITYAVYAANYRHSLDHTDRFRFDAR